VEDSLTGATALILVVHPRVQYSQKVYEFNTRASNTRSRNGRERMRPTSKS